ncbi:hypothetical protein F3Y22_tig00111779pilonHSYRG00239 [Hibiscus syriacus]|uniref:Uncharacterized protein n=1 Tax=Hibiscus syriacus TaxID=106335 RepID=A0A6A2XE66_HIBSY|nr:hypothetical protein F3Y22_tig00111779pilonHSYRG00239 [Hibiscus syriacus]
MLFRNLKSGPSRQLDVGLVDCGKIPPEIGVRRCEISRPRWKSWVVLLMQRRMPWPGRKGTDHIGRLRRWNKVSQSHLWNWRSIRNGTATWNAEGLGGADETVALLAGEYNWAHETGKVVLVVEPLIWGLDHVDLQPDRLVLEPFDRSVDYGSKIWYVSRREPEGPLGRDGDNDVGGACKIIGLDNIAGFRDGFSGGAMEMAGKDDCIGGGTDIGTDTAVGRKTYDNAEEDPSGGPGGKDEAAEEPDATTGLGTTGFDTWEISAGEATCPTFPAGINGLVRGSGPRAWGWLPVSGTAEAGRGPKSEDRFEGEDFAGTGLLRIGAEKFGGIGLIGNHELWY